MLNSLYLFSFAILSRMSGTSPRNSVKSKNALKTLNEEKKEKIIVMNNCSSVCACQSLYKFYFYCFQSCQSIASYKKGIYSLRGILSGEITEFEIHLKCNLAFLLETHGYVTFHRIKRGLCLPGSLRIQCFLLLVSKWAWLPYTSHHDKPVSTSFSRTEVSTEC